MTAQSICWSLWNRWTSWGRQHENKLNGLSTGVHSLSRFRESSRLNLGEPRNTIVGRSPCKRRQRCWIGPTEWIEQLDTFPVPEVSTGDHQLLTWSFCLDRIASHQRRAPSTNALFFKYDLMERNSFKLCCWNIYRCYSAVIISGSSNLGHRPNKNMNFYP